MLCVLLMLAMMGGLPALIHYSYSRASLSNLNALPGMSSVSANASQPLVIKTHRAIWERYHKIYANTTFEQRYSVHPFEPGRLPYEGESWMSRQSMQDSDIVRYTPVMPCSYFSPFCRQFFKSGWVINSFGLNYRPPSWVPSTAWQKWGLDNYARQMVPSVRDGSYDALRKQLRGDNLDQPAVAVIYNGIISRAGSVLSKRVYVDSYGDFGAVELFLEQSSLIQAAPEYDEVVVISHTHQDMFWHLMINQFYRVFTMLPFLQRHPDIKIHVWEETPQLLELWSFVLRDTDMARVRSRLVFGFVKAKVIYYTQQIDREDVPSLALCMVIQREIRNLMALPVTATPYPVQAAKKRVWQVLYVVRYDAYRGRIVINFDELTKALSNTEYFPHHDKFNVRVHWPEATPVEALRLYAQADIVVGPHGAGFAHMLACRTGALFVEVLLAPAIHAWVAVRMGLVYVGHAANETSEGLAEGGLNLNYRLDVPQLARTIAAYVNTAP